jgi:hypothetical protein
MAINVSQSFHRTSANPVDDTMALTKAEMLTINDNLMPSKYLTICQDDGYIYLYDKANTVDPTTGKFRKFEGGSGGGTSDYPDLTNKPQINGVELSGNKTASDLGLAKSTDIPSTSDCYKTGDTAFTALADADYVPVYDTSASAKKKTLWSNIKSVLKTYFDTLYVGTAGTGLSKSSSTMSIKQFASEDMDEVIPELPSVGARYHQYSTEEQVVGTWIDGATIYEKTFTGAMPTVKDGTTSESVLVQGELDSSWKIVGFDAFSYHSSGQKRNLNSVYMTSTIRYTEFYVNSTNQLKYRSNTNANNGGTYFITVRYTKS